MSTAIAVVPPQPLAITSEQIKIARETVAKGLDDNQFAVYLYNCQRQGIHPLDGLLVPILRTDDGQKKLTFVTTVDLLRSRASETDEYAGSDDAIFEYEGEDRKKPIAATVTVWRFVQGQKCSFTATARYDEYYPGDKQGFMWKTKPHIMLGKCSEGLALRKGFPKELAGLYLAEELEKDNSPSPRAKKDPPKPVGNVKCSECNAIGGHLPKCSKKQGQQVQEAQPGAPADKTMCSECRQIDGHKADCPHAKPVSTSNPEFTEAVVLINSVEEKLKKEDKAGKREPYLLMAITDRENLEWNLLVWHKSMHQYLKGATKQVMHCEFSTRVVGDKTYCSLEKILELNGVTFTDNVPVPAEEDF